MTPPSSENAPVKDQPDGRLAQAAAWTKSWLGWGASFIVSSAPPQPVVDAVVPPVILHTKEKVKEPGGETPSVTEKVPEKPPVKEPEKPPENVPEKPPEKVPEPVTPVVSEETRLAKEK